MTDAERQSPDRQCVPERGAREREVGGTVEVGSDAGGRLEFDARDIWPGLTIEDCVLVAYTGSVSDVDIRLLGEIGATTGLDQYLAARIEVGSGGDSGSCAGFTAFGGPVFDGNLAALAAGTYSTAPSILPDAMPGDEVSLRITVEVLDDNAAQGLTADFSLLVEARP